jgi:type I restriction enzyme M protein
MASNAKSSSGGPGPAAAGRRAAAPAQDYAHGMTDEPDDAPGEETEEPEEGAIPDSSSAARGFIEDYISGQLVKATAEETEAVQVFSRRLVEDYGYPKANVQTRPQWRVRSSPGSKRSFPVDIAVFKSAEHTFDNLLMVVECKRPQRKDGIEQLELYMDMSQAEFGVWFNGDDHYYVRKVVHSGGTREWDPLPGLPKFGQRVEDIGLYLRRDLVKPSNLKAVFRDIRNHLAGNTPGITRDETLAVQLINLLFCKIYDEVNTAADDMVSFRRGHKDHPRDVCKRVLELFEEVRQEYPDVIEDTDAITLDPGSVAYVVGELQPYTLIEADRDAIGEAFEIFVGPVLRGPEGQFFTPRNVVRALVEMADPKPGEMIIDPACGSGGFLTVALEYIWEQLEEEGRKKGWSETVLERRKRDVATRTLRGLDKDGFLAKCTKAYMAILGDGRGGVFRIDSSLAPRSQWPAQIQEKIPFNAFHVVLTNPPFGKKIRVTGADVLKQYDMGHKWVTDRATKQKEMTDQLQKDFPPQLLFLERSLQLLQPGGRLGIVLPESLFGSPSYSHVIRWLQQKADILAIAAMPEPLFKTGGKQGTHTKVCIVLLRKKPANEPPASMFMADAKWCGHDSRGNPTIRKEADGREVVLDDIPTIAANYVSYRDRKLKVGDHLGFAQSRSEIIDTILIPKYYDPEIRQRLAELAETHDLITIGDLIESGDITISTGVEVGKMAYGTGEIPFIRTSDLSNWELKADPKHGVSDDLYAVYKGKFSEKFDVCEGDILLVKDGTYLVGTSAVVSYLDTKILYQSHLLRIRVDNPDVIDPWLLFTGLNSPIVKRQIRAKRFTQDIIDTLGKRLSEVLVPVPRDRETRMRIARQTKNAVQTRARLREETRLLAIEIEGEQAHGDISSLVEAD